ncbi:MAG: TolC family protein [Akkermansiaceae bacterium]|nr:TolC family protein [Akkermansiaceae bacterium]
MIANLKTLKKVSAAAPRRAWVVAATLLIVGCQAYEPKPLDPQANAIHFGKRRLDDPQVRSSLAASGSWSNERGWPPSPWKLRELQGAALFYHPEIAVAKAKAATARAAIVTADTTPNPTFSFGPERGNPGDGVNPWVLGFSLDYQVETANKRGDRTAQAQAQANAAALSIADTAWTVSSGVRAALLELESATQRLEVLEAQRKNDDATVSMVAERIKAGEAPRTDLAVYQTQQCHDLLDLADGRSKLDATRAKLADAVGVSAVSIRGTAVSFGPLDHLPEIPSERSLRKTALIRRSDVLGALEDYAAADAALRLEVAKQVPDLHLNPGYTFDQGQLKWAIGLGLTLPIDRNAGPIREAIAKRDEAAAVFDRLQIGIRGELDQSLASYQADRQRLAEVESLVGSLTRQLADAERLSKAGEGDRLAVNTAESLVLQARLARIDALTQAQQSLGRLQDSARISIDEH